MKVHKYLVVEVDESGNKRYLQESWTPYIWEETTIHAKKFLKRMLIISAIH